MKPLHKSLIGLLVLAAVVAGYSFGRIMDVTRQNEASQQKRPPIYPHADDLIGQQRPDFLLQDLDGTPQHISEWKGKALLINFWATWCAPCRDEIPALNAVRAKFKDAGFEVIGVALDDAEPVRQFSKEYNVEYPLLIGQSAVDEVLRRYGDEGGSLPYSVFIRRNGLIQSIHATGALKRDDLEKKVRKLLEK